MTGTFSSLNTALSALRYQQVALDIASTNVANSSTEGYVRRRVVGETLGAGSVPALWSRSTDVGNGVRATGVERMVDSFLEARARSEHARQSRLDTRSAALSRLESGVGEPGDTGVAAALTRFRSSLHDLANAPASAAARSQVLAAASGVADTVRLQARNVAEEATGQRAQLLAGVAEVNTVAADLAATNRAVAVAKLSDSDSSTLTDTRDRLALRLAELTGGHATVRPDGGVDVDLNGVALVTGQQAATLRIASGVTASGAADGLPVSFVVDPAGTPVPGVPEGMLGAVTDLLDHTLPAYAAGLSDIAQRLADAVNAQHAAGYDAAGNPGGPLFGYDPADVAGSLAVVITDPAAVAASGLPGGVLDAGNADLLAGSLTVDGDYQRLVNGLGTEVASVQRQAGAQRTLTTQVDTSREQLAGVNLDEETVNMLTAQHAYEAAARVMTTMDSVLDTLINRTGLVR